MARDLIHELDHMEPAAFHVKLGVLLQQLITNQNSILAKLDGIGAAANIAAINAAAGTTNVTTLAVVDLIVRGLTAG
jgi:hypothetical protein